MLFLQKRSLNSPPQFVVGLIPNQDERVMPCLLLTAVHIITLAETLMRAVSKRLAPSERILRILVATVELGAKRNSDPSDSVLDDTAHAYAKVKSIQIRVEKATTHRNLFCKRECFKYLNCMRAFSI